jgi:hypothetical protein
MKNETQVRLAKAVLELSAASPPAWNAFMAALAQYLDDVTEACISAPPADLPERQGRAREIRDVFKALASGRELAAQIAEKERKDGSRTKP